MDNFLVPSDLTDLEVDLIPKVDETIDLGSPTLKWKDLYLSGDSIYLGDIVLKETDAGLGIFGADGETAANIAIAPNSLTDAVLSDDTGQIKNKVTLVEGRLDVVQGASNIEGSIAKALKDAKDYTDIAELGFGNNYSVATIEERDALTNLFVGDLVFVADTGSEK